MDTRTLTEYLAIVVDMEKDIYTREMTLKNLKRKANALAIAKTFTAPEKVSPPPKPRTFSNLLLLVLGLAVTGFGVWQLWDTVQSVLNGEIDFFLALLVAPIALGLELFIFGFGLFLLGASITSFSACGKLKRQHDEDISKYNVQLQQYQKDRTADQMRIAQEDKQKTVLQEEMHLLNDSISESKARLKEMYALNILYPKYQELAMVCSIYEYLCAGRCRTLGEAYNILETEIRLDKIISKVDHILFHLDEIRNTQRTLYSVVLDGKVASDKLLAATDNLAKTMASRLGQVAQNSAIAAYHAERTQKELAYMNRMNYYAGHYSGATTFDLPPSL